MARIPVLPREHTQKCSPPKGEALAGTWARAAIIAVLPVLEASVRLEFYPRALSLAADVRRSGDDEAVRLAEELCRKLAKFSASLKVRSAMI
jgi:hypothetical protein